MNVTTTHIVPVEVVRRVLREEEADVVALRREGVVKRGGDCHLDHRLLGVAPALMMIKQFWQALIHNVQCMHDACRNEFVLF